MLVSPDIHVPIRSMRPSTMTPGRLVEGHVATDVAGAVSPHTIRRHRPGIPFTIALCSPMAVH